MQNPFVNCAGEFWNGKKMPGRLLALGNIRFYFTPTQELRGSA
jgi:hypothetical protein